jgi:SNF2 family DNA or RNA helicase
MLDLISSGLEDEGYKWERIDGTMSLENRREAIERFRNDPLCTILLASLGSAGVG